jgi:hypothetical protein
MSTPASKTLLPNGSPVSSPTRKSPRNISHRHIQEQQRRDYLSHLTRWSLSHDSCLHFHGKISLLPLDTETRETVGLGKSVPCILTDASFSDARRRIVIRLFPPQHEAEKGNPDKVQHGRQDSLDPFDSDIVIKGTGKVNGKSKLQLQPGIFHGHYKLVIRSGSGWMSARDYFSKIYLAHLGLQEHKRIRQNLILQKRSTTLGSPPLPEDSVVIRPLFHPFLRLAPELQELILCTAIGHKRSLDLIYDIGTSRKPSPQGTINISTLFRISKALNQHLLPYILHSTDFHFGLTGFTNFLWRSGPTNRREFRRMTFHFGKAALLHCLRWLAPDPVHTLFQPPIATNPRALQYFWRCQIQDLVQELHLLSLTIDVRGIPVEDVRMVLCIVRTAFGSIERLRLVETQVDGTVKVIAADDARMAGWMRATTWRELCAGYFGRYKRKHSHVRFEMIRGTSEDLEEVMDTDSEFFDSQCVDI